MNVPVLFEMFPTRVETRLYQVARAMEMLILKKAFAELRDTLIELKSRIGCFILRLTAGMPAHPEGLRGLSIVVRNRMSAGRALAFSTFN
jgi:hypothetical protein